MARLQILELPMVHVGDASETPFILVIDEWDVDSLEEHAALNTYWDDFAKEVGARGVLFVDRTIDIPANDVPLTVDEAFKVDVTNWADDANTVLRRIVEAMSKKRRPRADDRAQTSHDYTADA